MEVLGPSANLSLPLPSRGVMHMGTLALSLVSITHITEPNPTFIDAETEAQGGGGARLRLSSKLAANSDPQPGAAGSLLKAPEIPEPQ